MRLYTFISRFVYLFSFHLFFVVGTPTTGSKSAVALEQLYRLLQFLRHPRLVHNINNNNSEHSMVKSESAASLNATSTSSSTITTTTTNTANIVGVKRKSYSDLPTAAEDTNSTTSGSSGSDFLSIERWHREVIVPCLAQQESAWQSVMDLLQDVLLRHTKVLF